MVNSKHRDTGAIMKAVRCRSFGDSGVLVYEDADRPVAGPGQVVVKVAGAAFDPLDAAIRAGFLRQVFPAACQQGANYDMAGVITEIGEGVSGWRTGDAVVASLPMTGPGAAEYVAVPAETLAAAPRTVELADAAALPLAGLAAWQSLFEHADLKAGQSVLVNGAGGAAGGYAVQLARQAGATVTAAASARSIDRLRSYGADRIVDAAAPLLQAVAGQRFDVVLNLAPTCPEETAQLVDLVTDGGAFVSTTTRAPDDAGRGVRTVRAFVRSDTSQLAELIARVDAGELKIEVAERQALSDLPAVSDQAAGQLADKTDPHPVTSAYPAPGNHAGSSSGFALSGPDAVKAIFGPNTPRVLQFLTRMRKLSPAEIDVVASSWSQASPLDRARAWAHLTATAKEDYPVMAAASAARRAAMETARTLGRSDWAFWAAAWDAGAALTADDLPDGDYETLTFPLHSVMPALKRGGADDWGWVPSPRAGQPGQRARARAS
jgi:NADPH:quinone reductase-like Zn-dependent oxidoreductase